MPRVVSLFLPTWPTDRLGRTSGPPRSAATSESPGQPSPETPVVLAARAHNRRVVFAANLPARSVGLRVGMTVTQAQALVPGLLVREATPDKDAAALERLAVWALRYAPIAAADAPDGLVIDATGAAHLQGGEAAMLRDMLARLEKAGITARAAIAGSWGAAHGLARFGAEPCCIAPDGTSELLRRLPVAALRLPAPMLGSLRRLGFDTVGDLADQPRAPLALRFGPHLQRRLDQMFGKAAEVIETMRPPDAVEVRRNFAEPIGAAETLARYTGRLVAELCPLLESKGLGARRLDLVFHRVDAQAQAIRVGTAVPVRDVRRLTRLLCDRIETIDPGFGVEIMSLCASGAEPLENRQMTSLLADTPQTDVSDLIDTLANRVGAAKLYRLAPVASDVPERSVRRVPAAAPPANAGSPTGWPQGWPRPSRLLARPEPIGTVALLPDHPPVSFTWRGIRRRVKRADGPERVYGEWWKYQAELGAIRDYFRVEDETGERFWIFRAGDGEDAATGAQDWFLHGIFG